MRILSLQSGTSADGIDVAIVDVTTGRAPIVDAPVGHEPAHDSNSNSNSNSNEPWLTLRCVFAQTVPWPPELRERILRAAGNAAVTAEEICQLDALLGQEFAQAASNALDALGGSRADLVVSHGQTVHHWVSEGRARGTLQLGEASWIAEATRAPVLCNLRAADIAAGGQGAPFMGVFDAAWLGTAAAVTGRPQATLNLGGIANLSVVSPDGSVRAWDTGPANALVDAVLSRATNDVTTFDDAGALAATGTVHKPLLRELMQHPYLARAAPKSTGRETFGLAVVDALTSALPDAQPDSTPGTQSDSQPDSQANALPGAQPDSTPGTQSDSLPLADLVATLTRFTAESIVASLRAECAVLPERVIVSGGGVHNVTLMTWLGDLLAENAVNVDTSTAHGIDPNVKESLLFALLGFLTWHGIACTLPGTAPGGARLAGQLVFGPEPVRRPEALTGIRGLTVERTTEPATEHTVERTPEGTPEHTADGAERTIGRTTERTGKDTGKDTAKDTAEDTTGPSAGSTTERTTEGATDRTIGRPTDRTTEPTGERAAADTTERTVAQP
jgi:anhydro-N-acetylmuramic acid kinase